MPIKYIGREVSFKGKTLWEILGNLKNHGVGRMVIRSQFQRYPEPCYMRILKVAALPIHGEENPDNVRKVVALVDKVFRGKRSIKPVQLESVTYKADYILVPKDQESNYLNASHDRVKPVRVLPPKTEFPPLMKAILQREKVHENENFRDLKLNVIYNLKGETHYKVAEENEIETAVNEKPTILYPRHNSDKRL